MPTTTKTAVAEVPDFFIFYEGMQASIPHRPTCLRIGQYVFNCLHSIRPDVANAIRGTLKDPFYWREDKWNKYQSEFWDRVMDLWEAQ